MRPPAQIAPWLSEEELAIWVRDAPSKDAYQKRLTIWFTHLRHSAADVADLLQISKPAVWLWVGQYNRIGPQGLSRKGRGGRRWSFLSWKDEERLLQGWESRAIRGEILTTPQLLGEVEKAVGRAVSVDYVYRLLHRHRWRKLGPRPRHVKADRETQADFKKNFSRIVQKATCEAPPAMRVRVLFQDEGRFGRISDCRRCWGPLPKRPEVGTQGIREFIYSVTAVCPEDGHLASLIMPTVDTEIMSIFLAHTASVFQGDYCLMFLDGAGWHTAHELRVPENIRLMPLPPYSPELNPVEGIWDHLRENYFGNRPLSSLDEVEDRLCQGFEHLFRHPEIVSSITNYPWLNTISLTSN